MLSTTTSFINGFRYGSATGSRELTRREVEVLRPDLDPDAFAQGMIDGLAGDRFRFDLAFGRAPRPSASSRIRRIGCPGGPADREQQRQLAEVRP